MPFAHLFVADLVACNPKPLLGHRADFGRLNDQGATPTVVAMHGCYAVGAVVSVPVGSSDAQVAEIVSLIRVRVRCEKEYGLAMSVI